MIYIGKDKAPKFKVKGVKGERIRVQDERKVKG